jgi:hypothetical protein
MSQLSGMKMCTSSGQDSEILYNLGITHDCNVYAGIARRPSRST